MQNELLGIKDTFTFGNDISEAVGQSRTSYLVNSVTPFRNQAELRYRDMLLLWKPLAQLSSLLRFYFGPRPRGSPN